MRLIDADALKNDIQEYFDVIPVYIPFVFRAIEVALTIHERHGYWEESPTGNKNFNYCSVCDGAIQKYDNETFAYCPHCGARMER